MWIDPTTRQVYGSLGQVRAAYPHVSFPTTMTDDVAAVVGLQPVVVAERPACPTTHTLTADVPALQDGVWVQGWVLTPRDIDELRAELHAHRVSLRLHHQTSGFIHQEHTYASDRDESIPLLTNATLTAQTALASGAEAIAAFESELGDGWRSTDGVARITTAAGIVALHASFVAHGAACDRRSQAIKSLIDAAETLEDLAAVEAELATGWPEVNPS